MPGTELATAYIALVPTTKGIKQNLERDLVGPATVAGQKAGKGFSANFGKIATGLGIAAGAAALKSASGFATAGKEVMQLKRLTGGTTEEMSRLRFAAEESGVSTDALGRSIGLFSRNLSTGKLDQLGLGLKNARGEMLPMNEALLKVADRFKSMQGGAEKNALALKIFGRSGLQLLPFLNRGAAGLSDLEKEADKMGVTLNDKTLKAVKDNVIAGRQFHAQLEGLQISLGKGVLPMVTTAAKEFGGLASAMGKQPPVLLQIETGVLIAGAAYVKLVKPIVAATDKYRKLIVTQEAETVAAGESSTAITASGVAMKGLGAVAIVGGTYLGLKELLSYVGDLKGNLPKVDAITTALDLLNKQGSLTFSQSLKLDTAGADWQQLQVAIDQHSRSNWQKLTTRDGWNPWSTDMHAHKIIKGWDTDLAAWVSGHSVKEAKAVIHTISGGDDPAMLKWLPKVRAALGILEAKADGTGHHVTGVVQSLDSINRVNYSTAVRKIGLVRAALDKASGVADSASGRFSEIMGMGMDPQRDAISIVEAQHSVYDDIKKNGATFDIQTAAGRENRTAYLDAKDAIVAYAQAQEAAGVPMAQVKAEMKSQILQLTEQAIKAGASQDQIKALNGELKLSGDRVDLAFKLSGMNTAYGAVEKLNWKLLETELIAKRINSEFNPTPSQWGPQAPYGPQGGSEHLFGGGAPPVGVTPAPSAPGTHVFGGGAPPPASRSGRGSKGGTVNNYFLGPVDSHRRDRETNRSLYKASKR